MLLTPGEVPVLSDPYGKLHEVKFDDRDLDNYEAFHELIPMIYFDTIYVDDGVIVVPQRWVSILDGSGLLNLLRMPHFSLYNVTDQLAR